MPSKNTPSKKLASDGFKGYSEWSRKVIKQIGNLTDECLDRYNEDKKINTEILLMLAKLETLIKNKYG
jgi:hypothetical protein